MTTMQTTSADHAQFEAICARVDNWEPLPTVTVAPAPETEAADDERAAPLDGLILAGLVCPY